MQCAKQGSSPDRGWKDKDTGGGAQVVRGQAQGIYFGEARALVLNGFVETTQRDERTLHLSTPQARVRVEREGRGERGGRERQGEGDSPVAGKWQRTNPFSKP